MRLLHYFYRAGGRWSTAAQARVTRAGAFLLGATVVSAVGALDSLNSMQYQIFSLLTMIVLVGATAGALGRRGRLEAERTLPRHATAGHPLRYRVRVRNAGRWRLAGARLSEWVEPVLPDYQEFRQREEPFERKRNVFDRVFKYYRWLWLVELKRPARFDVSAAFTLARREGASVEMTLTPLRRGVLRLGPIRVLTTDPFGLFLRSGWAAIGAATVVVLPKRYGLPALEMPGSSRYDLGGRVAAAGVGHSDEFVGLRDYRPGDPPRNIHWRSWARLGRPVVKEFEDETFPRYALVLDTLLEDGPDQCFEEAVSVAASFAATLDTKESFLDLLFVGPRAIAVSASGHGSAREVENMLEVLALVEPVRDPGGLALLRKEVGLRSGGLSACILVLLGWDADRRALAQDLRRKGVETLVLVVTEGLNHRPAEPGVTFLPAGMVRERLLTLRFGS
ncbi:MAG TPA: DUF58 domain-containing protein [Verrucomicrobiales bacterium]|nr:DUF58 domain-containing protein [Verrucomicrobiales bacterium]